MFQQLLTGAVVSILVTLVASAACAALVSKEVIAEQTIAYFAIAVLLLASIAGAKAGSLKMKEKKLAVCLMIGLIYACLLLSATAMFFDGQYQAVGVSLIVILSGSVLAVLLRVKHEKKLKKRGSKKRRR